MNWQPPEKPAEFCENRLIAAILSGQFAIDSTLPGERDLAASLGVTRPTLREALQRLARDGWLEIRQGKPTRVRNYWREGNLGVLAAIAGSPLHLPGSFPADMLAIRTCLAPTFTRLAVERAPDQVVALLRPYAQVPDDARTFTEWDWRLQHELTLLSGNPVFTLIYNSFAEMYQTLGVAYFAPPGNRAASQAFYRDLLRYAESHDGPGAGQLVLRTMQDSQRLWDQVHL